MCVCACVCVCVCVTLASVRCNSTRESWTKPKLGIWICHSKKVCPIVFGGGQKSCGVTRGQRPKTLFARYLKMTYGEKMNPLIFGGGQRSFGVTESQILKTLLMQYLKEKILDRFHT
ncbi:hypothetical protein HOLleu_31096 [Holothuria leucospilota]|uniref:Secreted protein n=1 Tax=Holothuria leucospilota TaxID=206669 RepID=A0A9Q1BLI3_HOLLE|nr:hypothetical protein HOLleu_31096 [Holothuria leucospilota]